MAELADAPDLGSGVYDVQVQVLSPAPKKHFERSAFFNDVCLGFFVQKSIFDSICLVSFIDFFGSVMYNTTMQIQRISVIDLLILRKEKTSINWRKI